MSGDYNAVGDALAKGADPAMLCATCPWDRACVSPPTMTRSDIDAAMEKAKAQDDAQAQAALARGEQSPMPTGSLLTVLMMAGRDTHAAACPVFALRLRSSGGRGIADTLKASMQSWDDQS